MQPRSAAIVLLLTALALGGCQSASTPSKPAAEPAPTKSDVFEPASGVSCNHGTKVCDYKGGPSVGLTRLFFGDKAADAIQPRMAAENYPYDPIFKPNPSVSCDTLVTTCYDASGASYALTDQYFGPKAKKMLEKRHSQVVRFGLHVTCDNTTKVCFDRFGAGVGITRMYIDEAASNVLLARLRGKL